MELPEEAIRRLVQYSSSNAELAIISNVCRKWRDCVAKVILEVAKESLESGDDDAEDTPLLLLPSMIRYVLSKEKNTNNELESYCLAWFSPSGIRFKQLPLEAPDDSDLEDPVSMMARDHRGNESPQQFAPGGEHMYAGSEDEKKKVRRQPGRSNSLNARLQQQVDGEKFVNCLYQWDGYKDPEEVLVPFGYSTVFIQKLLEEARSQSDVMDVEGSNKNDSTGDTKPVLAKSSTYAVRGATLARPEGYCLCWEQDDLPVPARKGAPKESSSPDVWQQKEWDELARRRRRRRRELQREVLPKILNSAPRSLVGRPQLGIDQPCVQFLNLDNSHAVRLFTPPFKPGPVPTPITVLCVGIATEDGCFVSGLKQRFEMGHLYPETHGDDVIERSPICICTDAGSAGSGSDKDGANKDDEDGGGKGDKDESFNSDDSSCDMSMEAAGGDPGFKCACPFTGLGDMGDHEHDDRPMGNLCRGSLGPGTWHCYVAVFDGVESNIRIDGEKETVRCNFPLSGEAALLDGLTIGADHLFDMSLCFGQGSDGDGEGAIAELAVFKGRLPEQDIEMLEGRLMAKYGIPSPTLPEMERAEENRFYRIAHAMLSHAADNTMFQSMSQRIPLRYFSKHRIVAWRQTNPVTGEPVRVQRIGTKLGDSSSDF